MASASASTTPALALPEEKTLKHLARLAVTEDKPIMFDYWIPSIENGVIFGTRANGDRLLVKSEEEYTSTIKKLFKTTGEYVVITENSIYVVSNKIQNKQIS